MADAVIAEVDAILEAEEEADAILRRVVAFLAERYATRAALRFVEDGDLVDGPAAGPPAAEGGEALPVRYEGEEVAQLASGRVLADDERAAWAAVAGRIAIFCLVGWDTGGESWEP